MILVTVGTTMPFDSLLKEVDRLVGEGFFDEPVVMQTGQSSYEPKNCEFFKFKPTLGELVQEASVVITHGGSTTVELMKSDKAFLAVPNPVGSGDHQTGFLSAMQQRYGIVWAKEVQEVESQFALARSKPYSALNEPSLADVITTHLEQTS